MVQSLFMATVQTNRKAAMIANQFPQYRVKFYFADGGYQIRYFRLLRSAVDYVDHLNTLYPTATITTERV